MSKRLSVYDGTPHQHGVTYLRLIQISDTEVLLAVVGEDGECMLDDAAWEYGGGLLMVADGRVALSPKVLPSLGFELDGVGRIRLDEYSEQMAAQNAKVGGKRKFRVVEP